MDKTIISKKMELEMMRKNHHMSALVVAAAAPSKRGVGPGLTMIFGDL